MSKCGNSCGCNSNSRRRNGERGKVTVVMDAQAGSCGKGKFIGYLSRKDVVSIGVNNFMSNAGHTFIYDDGREVMTQHLPTSIVNPIAALVIGPGSAITPDILLDEIARYEDLLCGRKVCIHPRAMVILPEHAEEERSIVKSGSTFKGCGVAQAKKIMRVPGTVLFGDWYNNMKASDECHDMMKHIHIMDTAKYINDAIDHGLDIMVEGSQGYDLDINYGLDYPYTTSRQCHAGQLVADCGISPRLVDEIIMIMRPYPIRISSSTEFGEISSGDYGGSEEITWDEIKSRCGAPDDVQFGEITTVTKRMRRVFELNEERLLNAVKINRPTGIAINFIQYIDWDAYKCRRWADLPKKARVFIDHIERLTGVPVVLIGTGPNDEDIIDMR